MNNTLTYRVDYEKKIFDKKDFENCDMTYVNVENFYVFLYAERFSYKHKVKQITDLAITLWLFA